MKSFLLFSIFISLPIFADTTSAIEIETPERMQCTTSIIGKYLTAMSACRSGDVMVGIYSLDPLQIRCGHVNVTCFRKDVEKKEPVKGSDQK